MRIIISLIIILFALNAEGGPWPQNKGEGYFKLSEFWIVADQHYTDTGEIDPNVTTGYFSSNLYAEFGLTSNLTGIVYFPFFVRTYFNNTVSGTTGEVLIPGEAINAIGDADIGLSYGLFRRGSMSVSIAAVFGIPLGQESGGSLNNLQTGDGEFNQMIRLDAGSSFTFSGNNGWISASLGYNNRSKGFSDEVISSLQVGVQLFDGKITPSLRVESRQSRFNGDPNLALNFTSIFSNNTEYVAFTPELAVNINNKLGVAASIGFTTSGNIILARPGYSLGIYYLMK